MSFTPPPYSYPAILWHSKSKQQGEMAILVVGFGFFLILLLIFGSNVLNPCSIVHFPPFFSSFKDQKLPFFIQSQKILFIYSLKIQIWIGVLYWKYWREFKMWKILSKAETCKSIQFHSGTDEIFNGRKRRRLDFRKPQTLLNQLWSGLIGSMQI